MTFVRKVPPLLSPFEPVLEFHSPFLTGLPQKLNSKVGKSTPSSGKSTHSLTKPASKPAYGHGSGYSYGSSYSKRQVRIRYPEGGSIVFDLDYSMRDWYDHAKHCWPEIEGMVEIPVKHASFSYDTPKFNACVYTATKDYLQSRWGISLHDTDRSWLARHPLATDDGIPQADFITCVHELVAPYDFMVDRVRVTTGSLMMGDHLNAWMMALGCNPFAMVDHKTTNAEAAEKMGMTLQEANELWRFEFGDDCLPGSIVGEKGWSGGNGVNVGNLGGHARYVAPRDYSNGNWFACIQLKRKEQVSYISDPPSVEYVPRKGSPRLQVGQTTDPNGVIIAMPRTGSSTAWDPVSPLIPTAPGSSVGPAAAKEATKVEAVPPLPVTRGPVHEPEADDDPFQLSAFFGPTDDATGSASSVSDDPFDDLGSNIFCAFCGTEEETDAMLYNGSICQSCHDELWTSGLACNKCEARFTKDSYPEPVAYDAATEEVEWRCPICHEGLFVPLNAGSREEPFETLMSLSCMVFMEDIVEQDAIEAARAAEDIRQLTQS